eukprot:CAMPEP_0184866618 /NCGR_PEP_ID=MMETSP0580-20130426/22979_1 /TAXON_ID=1118495 /ORGANISM="Dactyliosolen fragilissimus" /LENGTH=711 /DNA_ID=CAMNT_0027366391 /DNA_START=70 /DNA_END=2205 /DNA_ORIENTATION=+
MQNSNLKYGLLGGNKPIKVEPAYGNKNNVVKNDIMRARDVQPGEGGLVQIPNRNDVLSGRGGRINSHAGNVNFRTLVNKTKHIYLAKTTRKLEKVNIANKIVQEIRQMNPPGRFLKEDEESGCWIDIGDEKARKKAGQAMRENAPETRREMEEQEKEVGQDTPSNTSHGSTSSTTSPYVSPLMSSPQDQPSVVSTGRSTTSSMDQIRGKKTGKISHFTSSSMAHPYNQSSMKSYVKSRSSSIDNGRGANPIVSTGSYDTSTSTYHSPQPHNSSPPSMGSMYYPPIHHCSPSDSFHTGHPRISPPAELRSYPPPTMPPPNMGIMPNNHVPHQSYGHLRYPYSHPQSNHNYQPSMQFHYRHQHHPEKPYPQQHYASPFYISQSHSYDISSTTNRDEMQNSDPSTNVPDATSSTCQPSVQTSHEISNITPNSTSHPTTTSISPTQEEQQKQKKIPKFKAFGQEFTPIKTSNSSSLSSSVRAAIDFNSMSLTSLPTCTSPRGSHTPNPDTDPSSIDCQAPSSYQEDSSNYLPHGLTRSKADTNMRLSSLSIGSSFMRDIPLVRSHSFPFRSSELEHVDLSKSLMSIDGENSLNESSKSKSSSNSNSGSKSSKSHSEMSALSVGLAGMDMNHDSMPEDDLAKAIPLHRRDTSLSSPAMSTSSRSSFAKGVYGLKDLESDSVRSNLSSMSSAAGVSSLDLALSADQEKTFNFQYYKY